MKIYCAPRDSWDAPKKSDLKVVLYGPSAKGAQGSAGRRLLQTISRLNLAPPPRAWDLLSIALAAIAADHGCLRSISPDGWTREIDLSIAVADAPFWKTQSALLENTLRFLTGDVWHMHFTEGGISPKPPKSAKPRDETAVCLLSGGLDSLVGGIDQFASGQVPLFVSQVSHGDKYSQWLFAREIGGAGHHLQLNHVVRTPNSEHSQRARSLIFLAYGVLAATCLKGYGLAANKIFLIVPENGFISLNVPLTSLRLGSLSTRTTHPIFISQFQRVLDAAGLQVSVVNPYQFKTKGQMLDECANQKLLKDLAGRSTSCGRYARISMHCGRCVPCLIRRAAIHSWDPAITTKYKYKDLSRPGADYRGFDDVRAAAMAVEFVKRRGVERWTAGAINSATLGDVSNYNDVAKRGLEELGVFLKSSKVL